MKNEAYLVVEEKALPEVYQKVVQANAPLRERPGSQRLRGGAHGGNLPQRVLQVPDAVFPYTRKDSSGIVTVQLILLDRPGVLAGLLTVFYQAGANILTVNQNIPVKGAGLCVRLRADHPGGLARGPAAGSPAAGRGRGEDRQYHGLSQRERNGKEWPILRCWATA